MTPKRNPGRPKTESANRPWQPNIAPPAHSTGHTVLFTHRRQLLGDLRRIAIQPCGRGTTLVNPTLLRNRRGRIPLLLEPPHADLCSSHLAPLENKRTLVTTQIAHSPMARGFPTRPRRLLIDRLVHHAEIIAIDGEYTASKRQRTLRETRTLNAAEPNHDREQPEPRPACDHIKFKIPLLEAGDRPSRCSNFLDDLRANRNSLKRHCRFSGEQRMRPNVEPTAKSRSYLKPPNLKKRASAGPLEFPMIVAALVGLFTAGKQQESGSAAAQKCRASVPCTST